MYTSTHPHKELFYVDVEGKQLVFTLRRIGYYSPVWMQDENRDRALTQARESKAKQERHFLGFCIRTLFSFIMTDIVCKMLYSDLVSE